MIQMILSRAAKELNADMQGHDTEFYGCSSDSRKIQKGQLFIAIKGEKFNGHDFLGVAKENGAAAAMISEKTDINLPTITVNDVRHCMGKLAGIWRESFSIPLVAITGSNGKTTVKEMLSSVLRVKASVLSTRGNLNNDIGVPLTLYELGNEHAYAVIEMGANHPGEISWLTKIARPTIAIITQCAPAHLEGFGSIEGVANAKGEIYEGLDRDGIAIINTDDDFAGLWQAKVRSHRQISFGLEKTADVTAEISASQNAVSGNNFLLKTFAGDIQINLPLQGRHNIMNALAASACALALQIEPAQIKQGLENMLPVKGRLQIRSGKNQSTLIDDTYNANPASLKAALETLSIFPGKHWLVLGDMGELGPQSEKLHEQAGNQARALGVDKLFAIGPLSQSAVSSFGEGGVHFQNIDDLVDELQCSVDQDTRVLVKGSRSMKMERVVQALEVTN